MSTLEKKRRNKGETLIETLVAILILSLSAMLLAAMSATTLGINRATEAADLAYRAEILLTEVRSTGIEGAVSITTGTSTYTYPVDYYGKPGGQICYEAKTEVVAP